jgi:hypothetical protein
MAGESFNMRSTLMLSVALLAGCATVRDNEVSAIKIEPARKSTVAENIEASGHVLAGAWDRLTGKTKENP